MNLLYRLFFNEPRVVEGKERFLPGVGIQIESECFLWAPRWLPVVNRDHEWDGKSFKFKWLVFCTVRGYTISGYDAFVE